MMNSTASARQIKHDVAGLIKSPRRIKPSAAASEKMKVVDGGGKIDDYRPELTPYMIRPMDCLASRKYDAVVFIGPARTGKTNALIDGWVAYVISSDPGDMLIVQISEEKAREYSKKRIDRMLRNSPELAALMSPHGHDNNVHDKTFKAGNYLGIKWPTVNVLSSSDYRFVALTDYDRLPENLSGEGDPFSLATKRTQTFMSSGMTMVETSPGWDITDPDWKPDPRYPHMAPPTKGALALYNLGTRERLYWPCDSCSEWFQPILENFNLERRRPFCPHCGTVIEDPNKKRDLNRRGQFVPEGCTITRDGVIEGEPRDTRIASFWMEGPAATFQTWDSLAIKLQQAEEVYEQTGSQEKLKTTINTDWGRPYRYRKAENARSHEALHQRSEKLGERVVPEGVRCLFGSVDVQGGKKRRFVVQVLGYGERGERWVIDRFSLRKAERKDEDGELKRIDPAGHIEDWDLLISHVITRKYPLGDGSGREMPVLLTAIDSGGEDGVTENAYQFYRSMKRSGLHHKIMLVKGGSTINAPRMRETWPDSTGRKDRHASSRGDIPLHILNTNLIKDTISNHMERTEPGPNCCHFPEWLGEWFFEELTYEQRGPDGKWKKPGKGNNEAFDLMVYADAAATKRGYDKINWDAPPPWARDWDNNSEIQADGVRSATRKSNAPPPAERRRSRTRGRIG
ncbi:phage terminase large subunit family protein [Marinobacterium litorale]|uniref:phage terminase large subunit family protein n=1 Tax=Marinobacterium litorale TaxID=404770 RepID=UPI000410EADD|nr:terminase gpA endonuclease subunit [Marinobacterium litorale]